MFVFEEDLYSGMENCTATKFLFFNYICGLYEASTDRLVAIYA